MGWKFQNTGELWDGGTHQLGGETWTGKQEPLNQILLEWTNEAPKKAN